MKVLDLLKGKEIKVMTDAKVEVVLEIENVTEEHHSEDLSPPTPQNDWWPPTRDWTTFKVKFTNGFVKTYSSLSEINIVS